MADPYPAIGTHYRPNIEPSTTNRGLTLTAEQVVALRDLLSHVPDPSKEIVELVEKNTYFKLKNAENDQPWYLFNWFFGND